MLRSTPSVLMEVREAAWAKRWQRDTADSEAFVTELVSLRAQAIAEDVRALVGSSDSRQVGPNVATHPRQHRPWLRMRGARSHQARTC